MTTDPFAQPETRASRRALHASRAPQADPAAPTTRPRPVLIASSVVVALLLAAAAGSQDRMIEIVAVVVAGLVVAAGWPRLVGSASPIGTTVVLMVTALGLGGAMLVQTREPYLEHVPVAIAAGVIAMCLHPLVQASARVHLAQSLATTALGILVIGGAGLFASTVFVGGGVVPVLGIALAVAALTDLVLEHPGRSRWMIPAGMLVGGVVAVLAHLLLNGGLAAWPALIGVTAAGTAVTMRRMLVQQPRIGSVSASVAAGAASVLVVAPLVHLVSRLPLG